MLVERFKRFVPAVECVPDETKQYEGGIRGALEHTLPVHRLAGKAYTLMQILGRGHRQVACRVVGDQRAAVYVANKVDRQQVE